MRKLEMRNQIMKYQKLEKERREMSRHWAAPEGGKGEKDSSLEKMRNKLRINQTL